MNFFGGGSFNGIQVNDLNDNGSDRDKYQQADEYFPEESKKTDVQNGEYVDGKLHKYCEMISLRT